MMRSRLAFLKHIFCAVYALGSLLCALEVGLRLYEWKTGPFVGDDPAANPLSTPCRVAHHRLLPLEQIELPHPDTGTPVVLATNSLGLRGPEIEAPKPTGVFRIVCLGDERTLGPGVQESETFCARLQALLQKRSRLKIEVVNAGIPDYCPLLSFLQLKHSLLALQPDLLIVNFDMSDISDDCRLRRHARMSEAGVPLLCSDPSLQSRGRSSPRLDEQFLLIRWCRRQLGELAGSESHAADQRDIHTPQGRYAWLRSNPPDWSIYIEQALTPLAQMSQLAQGSFSRYFVAVCPAPWQASPEATSGNGVRASLGVPEKMMFDSRRPVEILAEFAQKHGLAVCNTFDPMISAQQPERLFLHNSPEFSPLGHELYARVLAGYVLTNVPGIWITPTSEPSDETQESPVQPASREVRTSRQ